MQTHLLSRNAKRALALLLTLAILLPIIALTPRYMAWRERQLSQKALNEAYTADASSILLP